MRAHQLAPQVSQIAMSAAVVLMRAGHFDDAIDVLTPIAYSPHPGATTQAARKLIALAKAHKLPEPASGAPS